MTEKLALITGACGFSAPWVIDELLADGWQVRCTDLKTAPKNRLSRFMDKIEFFPADITKPETLKNLFDNVDVVFHPAAIFSYSAPRDLLWKVNVEGTRNLLAACVDSDVKKMVMWSSVAAYGSADPDFYEMPIKELPLDELNPEIEGLYDSSKRAQERVGREYWEQHKFPISFMRLAPLYGKGSYYGMFALFKYINDEVLSVAPSNLGAGKASIPIVHAKDAARAAVHLSNTNIGNGEAFNIADDNVLDLIQTIKFIANLTGSRFQPLIPVPIVLVKILLKLIGIWSTFEAKHLRKKIDGHPPVPGLESDLLVYLNGNFWFDNEKIKKTGFEFDFPDRRVGLVDVIDWYNQNGWEKRMALKGSEQIEEGAR